MECENFDRFISHTSMDPLLFNNNADWEIDWSLVDSLAFPDSFDCLQFPETEKIAVQDAGIPWTEPDPLGLFDLTYDETDSQLGITEHDVASIFDNIKGTETPTPDIQKEIQELRQAITDMQQHMKKLDDMYFDIKEESERTLSCIFLIEEYAQKLIQWTSEFKVQVDGIGERLGAKHVE